MNGKKDEGKKRFSIFEAVKSGLSRISSSVDILRSEVEETITDAKRRINAITENLFSRIMSLFLIMVGLVFLFLGATYKIMNAGIDRGSSFMIMGVLVLLLGWVFMILIRKGK